MDHLDPRAILIPAVALVGLTFIVWVAMVIVRGLTPLQQKFDPQRLADEEQAILLQKNSVNLADNFENLCELPIFFYVAALTIYGTGISDRAMLSLAWAFVGLRVLHSAIHCTTNRIVHRFTAYVLGGGVLWLIWARIAFRLLGETR